MKKLSDLVDCVTKSRKSRYVSGDVKHISVLHINPNTTISFRDVELFEPVCKGRECFEGDIIFSKINPRIPRMAVIPKTQYRLVCSNEFEIFRPKKGIDPYLFCHILRTDLVKKQILNLTSGTSSSHNRIKTEQLQEILIPLPGGKDAVIKMHRLNEILKNATNAIYDAENAISEVVDSWNE